MQKIEGCRRAHQMSSISYHARDGYLISSLPPEIVATGASCPPDVVATGALRPFIFTATDASHYYRELSLPVVCALQATELSLFGECMLTMTHVHLSQREASNHTEYD